MRAKSEYITSQITEELLSVSRSLAINIHGIYYRYTRDNTYDKIVGVFLLYQIVSII